MADVILRRHKMGVKVRVITDLAIMEQAHGSQSFRFMKDGTKNKRAQQQQQQLCV